MQLNADGATNGCDRGNRAKQFGPDGAIEESMARAMHWHPERHEASTQPAGPLAELHRRGQAATLRCNFCKSAQKGLLTSDFRAKIMKEVF
ncbi:MAG TPA: hypothetical protein DEB70_08710 [Planctomycetaceae bacterium]|nr:hypothetical protein [Planctomycetaceae bacterium]